MPATLAIAGQFSRPTQVSVSFLAEGNDAKCVSEGALGRQFSSAIDMAPNKCRRHTTAEACRFRIPNKLPIDQVTKLPIAFFHPLRFVQVRARFDPSADFRDRIVGQRPFLVEARRRGGLVVLFVSRAVTLDRALVGIPDRPVAWSTIDVIGTSLPASFAD